MIAELLQTLIIVIGLGASANTNAQTPSFNNRQKFQTREDTQITETLQEQFTNESWTEQTVYGIDESSSYDTEMLCLKRKLTIQTDSFKAEQWQYEQDYIQTQIYNNNNYNMYLVSNQNVNRTQYNSIRFTITKMFSYGVATNMDYVYYFGNYGSIYNTNEYTAQNLTANTTYMTAIESNATKWESYINSPQWTQINWLCAIKTMIQEYQTNEQIPNTGWTDYIGSNTHSYRHQNILVSPNTWTYLMEIQYTQVEDSNNSTQPRIFNGNYNGKTLYTEDRNTISGTIVIGTSTTEIVDIPGLIFNVLIMPFSFYSTAFNLTLFPGTPYAINISNLVLSLLGVLIFIFIVNKIVKR